MLVEICSRCCVSLIFLLCHAFYFVIPVASWEVTFVYDNIKWKANRYDNVSVDGAKWCSHLRQHKEPNVIMYNRIPKSGSSTMLQLIEQLRIRNNYEVINTSPEYWGVNYDTSKEGINKLRQLIEKRMIYEKSKTKTPTKLVIDGHWHQFNFSSNKNANPPINIEYIQTTRECASRRKSEILYSLYDCRVAKAYQRQSQSTLENYQFRHLNISTEINTRNNVTNISQCFQSYECLINSPLVNTDIHDTEMGFLCGHKCSLRHTTPLKGAISNIHNPAVFTVVGILENFDEYMDMLECAYPGYFAGISSLYNKGKEIVAANVGSNHSDLNMSTLQSILHDSCSETKSEYANVYKDIIKTWRNRYLFMKRNRNNCCRMKLTE